MVAADEPKAVESEITEQVPEPPAAVVVTAEPESDPVAVAQEDAPAPPVERPWTPSYSVSRQGSRSSLKVEPQPAEAERADEAPAAVVITSEPETQEEAPATEEVKPTWTPSYSVSCQGSRSSLIEKAESKPAELEQVVTVPEPAAPVIVTPAPGAADETQEAPTTVEPPARPWTPSYSVSRQGSSPVPSPKVETVELPVEQTPPQRPWTPSYSVSRQGSSSQLVAKAAADSVSSPVAPPAEETVAKAPVISVDAPAVVVSEPEVSVRYAWQSSDVLIACVDYCASGNSSTGAAGAPLDAILFGYHPGTYFAHPRRGYFG